MGTSAFFDEVVNKKLLDMHTAYIGKVLSATETTATVQPLGMYKQYGEYAQKQAIVSNIPVVNSARYKAEKQTIDISGTEYDLPVLTPLSAGDIVICVCCDRDISQAKNGNNTVPAIGHHSLSDSVVVGIL